MIFTQLIQTNLRTKALGKKVEYYNRLDSTNEEAWELIDSGEAQHGMIVITDNQFSGKGRNKNQWYMSPSKSLAMSIIILEPIEIEKSFENNYPKTTCKITKKGLNAFEDYVKAMKQYLHLENKNNKIEV